MLRSILIINILSILFIAYFLFKKAILYRQKKTATLSHLGIIDSSSDVRLLLNDVDRQKKRLQIKLNNKNRSFTSSILKIDSRSLIIDALFPPEGNAIIEASYFIIVESLLKENDLTIPFKFQTSFLEKVNYKNYKALRVAFPEQIQKDQKRNFHRINLSAKDRIYIIFNDGNERIRERVENISGGGLGFYSNRKRSFYWKGRKISSIKVSLPDGLIGVSFAVVCTVSHIANPVIIDGKLLQYYYGVEFIDIDNFVRNSIIKFVVDRERRELRNFNRLN